MARFKSKLDNVRVAAPCNVDWDNMYGNERVRFCDQCQLNVYNLSEMTKVEAERLIGSAEGRLCVRFYRRRDGSILTQNCPVGLRALKKRLSRVANAIGSTVLSFIAGVGVYGFFSRVEIRNHGSEGVMGVMAIRQGEMALPPLEPHPEVGKMAIDFTKQPRIKRRK